MKVLSLDHLVLTVRDMAATRAFYERLGMSYELFTGADGTERHALKFGAQKINLHLAGQEHAPHAAQPVAGSADLCFLMETLEGLELEIEEGPVSRTGATGPLRSVYLRDPDGNLIELSERM